MTASNQAILRYLLAIVIFGAFFCNDFLFFHWFKKAKTMQRQKYLRLYFMYVQMHYDFY